MKDPVIGVTERFRVGDRAHVERVLADVRALGVRHVRTVIAREDWESAGGRAWFAWLVPRLAAESDLAVCVHDTSGSPDTLAALVDDLITEFGEHFTHVELDVRDDAALARAATRARARGKRVVLGGVGVTGAEARLSGDTLAHVDAVNVYAAPDADVARVRHALDEGGSDAEVWLTAAGPADPREGLPRFVDVLDAPVTRTYWPDSTAIRDADGRETLLHRVLADGGPTAARGLAWVADPTPVPEDEAPVVITGGSGFVGANLAHRLLSMGRPVLILDNLSRPTAIRNARWLRREHGERVRLLVADVRDADAVRRAVAHASAVFHLAAQVAVTTSLADPRSDFDVNAGGTFNVLEAVRARENPPPLVFASTNKVYGAMPDLRVSRETTRCAPDDPTVRAHGVSEARPLDFHSPYGCSKGAADQYVVDYARTYGLPATVFRMSCTYGPHQFGTEDQGWVAHFLIRALSREPITIYGSGHQVRDVLFVDDLVDAFLAAEANIDRVAGRAFNVGGGPGNTLSLIELLDMIRELEGHRPETRFAEPRVGDQPYYVSDTRAITDAIGWRPKTSVREGVRKLHAWLSREIPRTEHAPVPEAGGKAW